MNRFQVGRPWDSLFVLPLRNLEAFGRREEVVSKVRTTLVGNPEWNNSVTSSNPSATESENPIAEALQPR